MNERCLASEIQCFFCAALKGLFYASLSGRSFTLGSHSDLFPFLVRSFLAFLVGRWVTVLVRGSCLTGGLLTVLVRGSFVTFFESRWESVFADSFLGGASWWRSAWVLSAWVWSVSLIVLTLFVVSLLDAIWRVGSLVVVAICVVVVVVVVTGSLVVVVVLVRVVPLFSGMFCVCV